MTYNINSQYKGKVTYPKYMTEGIDVTAHNVDEGGGMI